ncbi:hypothetical protein [Massilia sp. CCM 8734]|uniref:hypothetical protein n=1 Tax=Massilia sp. CCM 8734 TaxID=2609283 RepID=UPI0014222BF1|nr:hypothetical protein [Massilia sp. CCM 8734]NHZ94604.1 hypothetical protein [Massilia sp. CCM 8734]
MTKVRRKCLEVPTNDAESATFKDFAKHVGMATAVFARFAMFHYIDSHDAKNAQTEESRPCRDVVAASHASSKFARKAKPAAHARPRGGFGSAPRPLRV